MEKSNQHAHTYSPKLADKPIRNQFQHRDYPAHSKERDLMKMDSLMTSILNELNVVVCWLLWVRSRLSLLSLGKWHAPNNKVSHSILKVQSCMTVTQKRTTAIAGLSHPWHMPDLNWPLHITARFQQ